MLFKAISVTSSVHFSLCLSHQSFGDRLSHFCCIS